jgi:hypothetical protein
MSNDSDSLLLGLDGVVVDSVHIDDDRIRTVYVQTGPDWVGVCPQCRGPSSRSKGWVSTRPLDIKIGPDRPSIVWRKRKWLCTNDSCTRKRFTESVPAITPRALKWRFGPKFGCGTTAPADGRAQCACTRTSDVACDVSIARAHTPFVSQRCVAAAAHRSVK